MATGKHPLAALLLSVTICAHAAEPQKTASITESDVQPTIKVAESDAVNPEAGSIADAEEDSPVPESGIENTPNDEPSSANKVTEQQAASEESESATPAGEKQEKVAAQATDSDETSRTDQKTVAESQPVRQTKTPETAPEQSMDMSQVIALLQQQQKDLAEQRKLLEAQSNQIKSLQAELDVIRAPAPVAPAEQQEQIVAKTDAVTQPLDSDQMQAEDGPDTVAAKAEEKKKAGDSVARAQADDPTRDLLTAFPGAWRLPGTDAALAIGGFVKTSVVYNFDPLEIKDRFIVGSIPVEDTSDIEAQSSITASQSRLNFDLREPTDYGLMRAFIEGDFASDNDTFRLRHAFGQWNKVLGGKTWSAFVDTQASPEEVDFEGLNGRINVRQSQIRFMPTIGQNYEFQLSLEDPNPQIQNGQGVTRAPDIVTTGRFQLHERLHIKLGLLGRQIRGQRASEYGGGLDKTYAWGATLSGRFMTPKLGSRDSLLFQLNTGDGIGRYVNDLSSVGNFDGIFNPADGQLELFDITSGYVSLQHWWRGSVRSNFTLGVVEVDNPGFVEGDAYKSTVRASANLFWMPMPRIDIGMEYLWGKRENEDGENDTATQFQLAARYRF